jgi:replicative DNA helicase
MIDHEDHTVSIRAEQAVLGALLADNDSLDRIADLEANHFYRQDHRLIFDELCRQIAAGQRADAITVFEKLKDKVEDCLKYLAQLRQSSVSAANITRHTSIIIDRASKRALLALSDQMREMAASPQSAAVCVDLAASRLEDLAHKKTSRDPMRIDEMLGDYADVLTQRMNGAIKPISTGHEHLDEQLDGGLERGTLTIIAGRPGMGKTAAGLGVARNVSMDGSALFFSMEMSRHQVSDRNVAALGRVPIKWLRKPSDNKPEDSMYWDTMTAAFHKARDMNLFIDDETGLNMMEIRAKARAVKRKAGLDLIVVDQLSFITGGQSDKSYEVVGEYTRALVALSKELDCAIILLCQLNRKCEERPNKRPILADLAVSGSIEQDAANIIFLYREVVYNTELTGDEREVCEWILAKQRQGEPGTIGMRYTGHLTRFDDLPYRWTPARKESASDRRQGERRGGFN